MTDENRKRNIEAELSRAEECLKEAEVLHEKGLDTGAVSRLYYHVFHIIRSLLLARGLEPKTHEGALRLLGMHFVKTGLIEPGLSHVFTKLMKYREEADYNSSYVFTGDDFSEFRTEASLLEKTVKDFLRREGLAG